MRQLQAAAAAIALTIAGTAVPAPTSGAPGAGDTYYPDYGNGGYDVSHYDVRLRYWPSDDRLAGTTTILATAKQDLSSFDLDFVLDVSSVQVNNRAAVFRREGDHELVVAPAQPVTSGQQLTVVVTYSGVPSTKKAEGVTAWIRTLDGAAAVGEPEEAWWWFPSNDHPSDKATFDVSVMVPSDVQVISNGVQPRDPAPELLGWNRWYWRSAKPQATYLAFITIGRYDITRSTAADGTPVINAYSKLLPDDYASAARASVERTAEITDWEVSKLGPWPFTARGGVVAPPGALGFALENQSRPNYSAAFFRSAANPYVIVHENAHQWFGDSVSVAQWKDIWLNEGFATYVQWLWSQEHGEGTAQELFDYTYATASADVWSTPPGDPGVARLFSDSVYDRGAMTLHQLRLAVGDDKFFAILRDWAAEHRYGNCTTAQFEALAERVSGKPLADMFQAWLYTPQKPAVATPAAKLAAPVAAKLAAPVAPKSWSLIEQSHARH